MQGYVRLPGKLFSPIDGMKNLITLSKFLAVSPAHHSVTGFMLSKHLLHRICYFSNGAPRTRSINTIRRLLWEWDTEITGSGPTMCLAAGANSITLVSPVVLQLWTSDSSTNIEHGRIFLRKHGFADVRSDFICDKATGTVAQQNISANQILSAGKFLMLRLHYLALGLKLKI